MFNQNMDEIKTVSERRKAINDEIAKINIERDAERDVNFFLNKNIIFKILEKEKISKGECVQTDEKHHYAYNFYRDLSDYIRPANSQNSSYNFVF